MAPAARAHDIKLDRERRMVTTLSGSVKWSRRAGVLAELQR